MAASLYVSSKALYDHLEGQLDDAFRARVAIGDISELITLTLEFLNIVEVEN